jgi:hypothetical protein
MFISFPIQVFIQACLILIILIIVFFRSLGFLVFLVSPTMGLFIVGVMLSYVSVRFGHLR